MTGRLPNLLIRSNRHEAFALKFQLSIFNAGGSLFDQAIVAFKETRKVKGWPCDVMTTRPEPVSLPENNPPENNPPGSMLATRRCMSMCYLTEFPTPKNIQDETTFCPNSSTFLPLNQHLTGLRRLRAS